LERNNRSEKEARKKELVHKLGRIINALKKDKEIKSIMLFGSLARGDVSATSDIDVIIVKGTKKKFLDRLDEIYSSKNVFVRNAVTHLRQIKIKPQPVNPFIFRVCSTSF